MGDGPPRTPALTVDGVLVDTPHEKAWRESLRGLMEGPWREIRDRTTWSPDAFTPHVYQTEMSGKPRLDGARAALRYFHVPDDEEESRVAQYADESNLICAPEDIPRKLEALDGHCANLGRDRSEIVVSYQTSVCIAPTHEQAVADYESYVARQPEVEARRGTAIVGGPDEVAQRYAQLLDTGIDGVTVNASSNGHIEGRVALLGETLAPLFIK